MARLRNVFLLFLLLHSLWFAAYDGYLYAIGQAPTERLGTVWGLVLLLLVLLWVDADSRQNEKVERNFDYMFLVCIFFPVYVPYYIIRTRGPLRGSFTSSVLSCCFAFPSS